MTMQGIKHEIEIAWIVDDVAAVRSNLDRAGYHITRHEHQENVYMDHPFLGDMIQEKKYLRFRFAGNDDRDDSKDVEISFSNPSEMMDGTLIVAEVRPCYSLKYPAMIPGKFSRPVMFMDFLKSIGFREAMVLVKDRECYASGKILDEHDVHFELDFNIEVHDNQFPGRKVKLEPTLQACIERDGNHVDANTSMRVVNAVASHVGLCSESSTRMNYFDRYFDELKRAGVQKTGIA